MPSLFSFKEDQQNGKYTAGIYWLLLLYICSLFLKSSPVVSNVFIAAITVLAFFNCSPKNYAAQFTKNKVNLGFILFFFLQVISLFYSSDSSTGFQVLSLRAPVFLLPLAFALINFEKRTWNTIAVFYAFATTIASVAGFVYSVFLTIKTKDTGYLYNDNVSDLLLGKQAVYFAFYVNSAVFIFISFLLNPDEKFKKIKGLFYLSIGWLCFICFLLASKTAMLSLLLISLVLLFSRFIQRKKWMELSLVLFSLSIGCVILSKMFPKTLSRFTGLTQTEFQFDNAQRENHFNAAYDSTKWNSTNTRVAIWQCAKELIQQQPVFGSGLGDKKADLLQKYKEKNFIYGYSTEKNTHSQYLDIVISMGIVGLMVFVFVFVLYPVLIFIKQKQFLALSIFALLAFCFLTENMLDRYQGEIIIGLLLPLSAKVFEDSTD